MIRIWDKSLGRQDQLHSGTAATLVVLEDVPDGAMDAEPYLENVRQKKRMSLTVDELEADIDWDHIAGIGAAHVLRTWVTTIPELKQYAPQVKILFTEVLARHQLRLRKSTIEPLQCSDINEATTAGVGAVLDDLLYKQLGIPRGVLGKEIFIVGGDALSTHHMRKVRWYQRKGYTVDSRRRFILDQLELWHLKWNYLKAIYKLNWWPDSKDSNKTTFGIAHDLKLLGREKFNHIDCSFYQGHENVEDIVTATCLEALRCDLPLR